MTGVGAHEALTEVICCRCMLLCMDISSSPYSQYISEVYICNACTPLGNPSQASQRCSGHYTAGTEVILYRIVQSTSETVGGTRVLRCMGHGGFVDNIVVLLVQQLCGGRKSRITDYSLLCYESIIHHICHIR